MIGKSIRRQLIVLTSSVLLLALLGSLFIALRSFNTTLRKTTYAMLSDNGDYLKDLLVQEIPRLEGEGLIPPAMKKEFDRFSTTTHLRITVIDPTGIVLYDSDYSEEQLDNHLWRQEVQKALTEGEGISERRSDTQGLPVLYHAQRVDELSEIAILRVSTTLNQLAGYQQTYRGLFINGLVVLVLLVGIITTISIATITRPLKKIRATAEHYAAGDLDARMKVERPIELAELATTMETMAARLQQTLLEIHEGRTRLETLLESMTEGIVLVDGKLVVRIANKAAKRLLFTGMEQRTIEGTMLTHAIGSSEIIEACTTTLEEGTPKEVTIAHFGHLFGETARMAGQNLARVLRISTVPMLLGGNITSVVITINDITDLQRLEQVRKDFVANVSHELKTPITAIVGFSGLLADSTHEDAKETAHFISIIDRQAKNMQRIVEDLLLLSSLEQQHAKPTCTWTTVDQIIGETLDYCRYKAQQRHTSIETGISNPESLEIWANGMLLVQALANLVTNAITYSDEGSTVLVEATVEEPSVTFRVRDTGCGIPNEAQQRIFERFYRVDTARSRSQGGTGLGLSIVKHIVGVHDGTVTVESKPGKGSTFTITLPRSSQGMEKLKLRSESLYRRNEDS
jgi:two-component system phosphate regulon sensor histidine kinase PhoR